MSKRKRNLVVRMSDDELAMTSALAEARDEPMSMLVRKLLRSAYLERFGVAHNLGELVSRQTQLDLGGTSVVTRCKP